MYSSINRRLQLSFKNWMKSDEGSGLLKKIKTEIFQYILIVDDCTLHNKYLVLLITILELTVLQYFYINPHYTHLNHFAVFQQYFSITNSYFFHIQLFANPSLSIFILGFYPFVIALVYLMKKLHKNKLLKFMLQVAIFIFPLLSVKILVELIHCFSNNMYLYITIPLGLIGLGFGGLISVLTKRLDRYIYIPIVIGIELNLSYYAIMVMLLIRLAILGYLFYSKHLYMLSYMFELGFFISMLSFLYSTDEFLNYLGFAALVGLFTFYGLFLVVIQFSKNISLYQKAQNIQQEQDNIFDVIQAIERHQIDCAIINCKCHSYLEIQPKKMKQFVYEFQQERFRRKSQFNQIIEYAKLCCERYQFRLSGLIKIYSHIPTNIYQEYNIFKICNVYEENLRKQDKDYNAGQSYFNINQEEHDFSNKVQAILEKIKVFWNLILDFDGSHKFLTSIRQISQSIVELRETYLARRSKYDDKATTFVHIMQLFNSIILNQKISEEDELTAPQPVIFIVTNQDTIINANNNFAILTNTSLQHLVNKSYSKFIPEIYRDVHRMRVEDYIQKVQDYQGKSLGKCFSTGQIEIKMVEMTHKVLPRFMNGLQIFTRIQYPVKHRKNINQSFMFIVEKDSFIIKNVEPTFFEIVRFKINQRNIKMLQQMALSSIFENFSAVAHSHSSAETTIYSQFLEQFTYMKKPQQNKEKRISKLYEGTLLKLNKREEFDQIYEYEVIKSQHKQDPYMKILFNGKSAREKVQQKTGESSLYQHDSTPTQEQANLQETKTKQVQFKTPYYMALFLLILHLIYVNIQNISQNTLQALQKRYQFYQAFDSTILSSLSIVVGIPQISKLQSLWIQGYGNFSESFNAFLNIKQPIFNTYFTETISTKFHNDLYFYIHTQINDKLATVNLYSIVLLVLVICGVIHFFVDFILALKYIFKIESKVGELLLQFVVISENDVHKFVVIIDHFLENILNFKGSQKKELNIPIQTVQESALQLMRGGSLSISIQEQQQSNFKANKKLNHVRRKSSVHQQLKRIQSSMIIFDLKDKSEKAKPVHKKQFAEESQNDRRRNIALFKEGYQNCSFIIKKNKKLFVIILLSLTISCTIILALLYVIYVPTTYFSAQLNILSQLHQSKIILMKSLEQIAISNYTLMPNTSVSNNLITIQLQLGKINKTSEFAQYYQTFILYLQQNACHYSTISVCSNLNRQIISYGLAVVTGYVEQYFRVKNQSALFQNSTSNYIVMYQIAVFEILIQKFLSACSQYRKGVHVSQLNYIIFGSILLCFALLASHLSLKEFKNRVEDSEQLLKIIPKEIKDKKKGQMQSHIQKELQ